LISHLTQYEYEWCSFQENEIKKNIGNYLPQISEILDRVPRPMIMIFKTNDLLRGVEHALKTQKT
jgi:aarF domain-containing kinase